MPKTLVLVAMKRSSILIWVLAFGPVCAAQENAIIRHADSATIFADGPKPLMQAVTALSEEYGWVIDFEDPPTTTKDTGPCGGLFRSRFGEPSASIAEQEPEEERVLLYTLVADYNKSGNPGEFIVVHEAYRRFAVVGTAKNGTQKAAILDTPVTIPPVKRDAAQATSAVLDAIAAKTHVKIGVFMVPMNALANSTVTVGGKDVPARVLLWQILSPLGKMYWQLAYDSDSHSYFFSVLPLKKAHYDASGKRTTEMAR